MPNPSDESTHMSLLNALVEGRSQAASWEIFVDKYGSILYRWCLWWGASPEDAEEVVQETLLVVFRKLGTYRRDPQSKFRSWLKTVAYRIWLQVVDVKDRHVTDLDGNRAIVRNDLERLGSVEARDDLIRRFDAMAAQEFLELAFGKVRERVEPTTWRCFERTSIDQCPGKQVAEELGLNVGAVFTNVSRVRKLLRDELESLDNS